MSNEEKYGEANIWRKRKDLYNQIHTCGFLGKLLELYILPLVCLLGITLSVACIRVFTKRYFLYIQIGSSKFEKPNKDAHI